MVNSTVLAGIVKKIYLDFNLNTFENRIKLQKIIYLLQAYGINLGYIFSIYIRGPYSQELTKTAYYIQDFNSATNIDFENPKDTEIFESYINKIEEFKHNIKWLEVASTLHLFKNMNKSTSKDEIITKVMSIKPFTKEEIEKVWGELKEWKIMD